MLTVYGDINSGNCYKVKLLMALLSIQHKWVHVDILKGDTQTASFREKNPNSKIPTLALKNGSYLWESNAILNYLAEGSRYLPTDRLARAKVLQWQFFEQYSHEPAIAVARFIKKYLSMPEDRQQEFMRCQSDGIKALHVMEETLTKTPYLVDNEYTIADISLYAYTHVAHEGGFDLTPFPAINAWISRISSHKKHVTIEQFL